MIYLPPHFVELDPDHLREVIEAAPLGVLITIGSDGLAANHVPFVFDPRSGPNGRLLAHVARANAVWRDHDPEQEALVVFQSADAYITPNWYATKQTTHEVVPTWNYAVVHAYGRIIIHDDVKWLRGQAGMLTKRMEATQPVPWKMADAPSSYVNAQLEQIVGVEIPVSRMIGKLKASQNRTDADAEGAIAGLRATSDVGGRAMAEVMESVRRR